VCGTDLDQIPKSPEVRILPTWDADQLALERLTHFVAGFDFLLI
jgi:hypothetical protein